MDNRFIKPTILIAAIFMLPGCKAFMFGYTWGKAQNSYYLVTGSKDSFGDRRINYNNGFHRHSELSDFLSCNCNTRGLPGFIYEYQTEARCRGIKLFYPKLDSVFVFEEPQKNNLGSIKKEARKMDDYERQIYERLKTKPY